ncbi:hypothetical protein J23TS9_05290 [Paenibacillus sp. J23TS9]|nr:hypothetical protein J23TS9_05290 [Paenibacillus sp. J23TS9]
MTNLHNLDIDDATNSCLVQIAQYHCKLALEHSKSNTLPERRESIKNEIQCLRAERDALLKMIRREKT